MAWKECKTYGFTDTEVRVADLLAKNLTNVTIATRLSVTPRTVRSHTGRIYGKLGLPQDASRNRRVEAIDRLRRMGLGEGRR